MSHSKAELENFLLENELISYKTQFFNSGIKSLNEFKSIKNESELEEFLNELNLKFLIKRRFKACIFPLTSIKQRKTSKIPRKSCEVYTFKVVLIGDSNTGKTSISNRFVQNEFKTSQNTTVGIDFSTKTIEFDDKIVKLSLWDTAGQERYNSITKSYYKGTDAIVLVYDITRKRTLDNIANKWIFQVRSNCNTNPTIVLVGNKNDDKINRELSFENGQIIANKYKTKFYECSAKSGYQIDTIFNAIALYCVENYWNKKYLEDMKYKQNKGKNRRIKLEKERKFVVSRSCACSSANM